MTAAGDSVYHLRSTLVLPETSGLRQVRVRVEQAVDAETYAMELLRPVALLPSADLPIFADGFASSWQLDYARNAELDTAAQNQVYEGRSSLAVRADNFIVEWSTTAPVEPTGYRSLRLAFHPGEVVAGPWAAFNLFVNGDPLTVVRLLSEEGATDYIDMDQAEWQMVEIPLTAFSDFEGPITSLHFLGDLQGTFYLDDLRLVAATPPAVPTAVRAEQSHPRTFTLEQNFPNPFNSETVIRYVLSAPGGVELTVFNAAGQQVETLVERWQAAGTYTVRWEGRAPGKGALASGLYLCRLRSGKQTETRKLLLLR
jgi:hypothetical protein